MTISSVYASSLPLRVALRTLAFLCASFVAVFSASAGYGLLKMLVAGMRSGADIGVAEFATHSGLTIVCFVLAGVAAYAAKKSVR